MQIHDPSVILVGLFVLLQGLLTLLSGRKAADVERRHQQELTQQARIDAKAKDDKTQENTDRSNLAADYSRVYAEKVALEAEMKRRDRELAAHNTNADDMFAMMAVPGAMHLLRTHRQQYLDSLIETPPA